MEAMKCPNCGSEKVKMMTDEKGVCLACDNVFLVHNLSKEFQATDAHISSMHQDLKEDINNLKNGDALNEADLLAKAEGHLKMENWDSANDIYEKLTQEFPQHSAAWYGLYKALTGNFEAVNRYALFVCDGNYLDEEDQELGEQAYFLGNGYIKRALSCEDANRPEIIKNVADFIRRCAEYGKADIENSIRNLIDGFEDARNKRDNLKETGAKLQKQDQTKALIPAFIVLALMVLTIMYFMAAGDWLGKVLGVVAFVLEVKYGGPKILNSIRKAKNEKAGWYETLSEETLPMVDDMDKMVAALKCFCVDLDNYNYVLQCLQDEQKFVQMYADGSFTGLSSYESCDEVDDERFIFDLLGGKMERYRYLLKSNM